MRLSILKNFSLFSSPLLSSRALIVQWNTDICIRRISAWTDSILAILKGCIDICIRRISAWTDSILAILKGCIDICIRRIFCIIFAGTKVSCKYAHSTVVVVYFRFSMLQFPLRLKPRREEHFWNHTQVRLLPPFSILLCFLGSRGKCLILLFPWSIFIVLGHKEERMDDGDRKEKEARKEKGGKGNPDLLPQSSKREAGEREICFSAARLSLFNTGRRH